MNLKYTDLKERKERLRAWWYNEDLDRPCIGFNCPYLNSKITNLSEITDFYIGFCLAKDWDNVEGCLDNFEYLMDNIYSGGDNLYSFFPNYGAGSLAAVFGVEPKYREGSDKYGPVGETVWYLDEIPVDQLIATLQNTELNQSNDWYARYLRVIEYAAKRAGNRYNIAMIDLGGVLDVLSSLLGPKNVILTMRSDPKLIEKACSLILEKMQTLYDNLQGIIDKYTDGCDSWLNLWCPDHYYPVQSDFSAMLNPKWFKRFALPYIKEQAEHLDHAIYHLDGEKQITHLDDILALECIDGIQWVPGAGKEITASMEWMPLYKKIQDAGKKVVLNQFEDPTKISLFYEKLNPDLLYISTFFMDRFRAEFYLPEFAGGKGGEGSFRKFKRERKKELKNK
jgi:5-methyltetrahydrofolate--homocysteine methyltransferase